MDLSQKPRSFSPRPPGNPSKTCSCWKGVFTRWSSGFSVIKFLALSSHNSTCTCNLAIQHSLFRSIGRALSQSCWYTRSTTNKGQQRLQCHQQDYWTPELPTMRPMRLKISYRNHVRLHSIDNLHKDMKNFIMLYTQLKDDKYRIDVPSNDCTFYLSNPCRSSGQRHSVSWSVTSNNRFHLKTTPLRGFGRWEWLGNLWGLLHQYTSFSPELSLKIMAIGPYDKFRMRSSQRPT